MKTAKYDRLEVNVLIIGNTDGPHIRATDQEICWHDRNGTKRLHLFIEPSGTPYVELLDGNGTGRILLSICDNGSPSITLRDGNFTERLVIDLGADQGEPEITLYDRSGKPVYAVGADYDDDRPYVREWDEQKNMRPWLHGEIIREAGKVLKERENRLPAVPDLTKIIGFGLADKVIRNEQPE